MATGLLRQTTAYTTHKDYRDHGTTGKTLKRSRHSPSGNPRSRYSLWLKCLKKKNRKTNEEHTDCWLTDIDRRRWSWLLDVTWHPIDSVGHQSWASDILWWLGDNSFVHKYRIGDLRDDDDWIHFPSVVDLMHNFGCFYGFLTSSSLA